MKIGELVEMTTNTDWWRKGQQAHIVAIDDTNTDAPYRIYFGNSWQHPNCIEHSHLAMESDIRSIEHELYLKHNLYKHDKVVMATSSELWDKGQIFEVVEFSCSETKPYYIILPADNSDTVVKYTQVGYDDIERIVSKD